MYDRTTNYKPAHIGTKLEDGQHSYAVVENIAHHEWCFKENTIKFWVKFEGYVLNFNEPLYFEDFTADDNGKVCPTPLAPRPAPSTMRRSPTISYGVLGLAVQRMPNNVMTFRLNRRHNYQLWGSDPTACFKPNNVITFRPSTCHNSLQLTGLID